MKYTSVSDVVDRIGQEVELYGWAETIRNHKKIVFMDLRDRTAVVQVVGGSELAMVALEEVVYIKGLVKLRPEKLINPKLKTGTVEVEVLEFKVIGKSKTPPLPINTDGREIDEEVRLRYRYLDLRRPRMANILKLRSDYSLALRLGLAKQGFIEVETPILTRSTKEGARDFIVPSRLQPGKFYALPQSPQQYKQMLMVAGVEKYFQFARCIRDEDLRADRGFEHTQLDLEMSFVTREDVMNTIQALVVDAVKHVGGKLQNDTFPVFSYKDVVSRFGSDKFDLRTDEEKSNGVLAFAWVINYPFFKKVDATDKAELEDGKSGWTFTHNPFSSPIPDHIDMLLKGEHIDEIVTAQYDLVCNGYEVGGGSIRANDPEMLRATYKIMGYSDSEIDEGIGHMLEALSFGAPPHGGIALGIDRHIMLLAGESSLKEAIAFPMNSHGKTAVMSAPSEVEDAKLKELGLKLR